MTKLLIIGSGGREHAIGIALKQSDKNPTLYFAPGNAGTALLGTNIAINAADINGLLSFAKETNIDKDIPIHQVEDKGSIIVGELISFSESPYSFR